MSKQYEKRDAAFEEWLEKEHPCHSVYDHETSGDYDSWLRLLRDTWNAGWAARKREVDYALPAKKKGRNRAGWEFPCSLHPGPAGPCNEGNCKCY